MMTHRRPIIAGNWKLNKSIKESIELVTLLKRANLESLGVDIVVCPPYTALSSVSEILIGSEIKLGAQDIYWEEKGAFTGEVSAALIKDAGASFVIVGHSERRQFFHETRDTVNKKTKAALAAGLTPIVCVGELLKEREAGKTFQIVEEQLKGAFFNFNSDAVRNVIVAYEPVWAIGTGKVATPAQAEEAHAFIRKQIGKLFGDDVAQGLKIQYGGSVKADNIADLMREADIDGALVGGASLDANQFAEIIKNTSLITSKH